MREEVHAEAAFSGYNPPGFLPRLEAAGADIVLELPSGPDLFVELVEVCLEAREAGGTG